MEPLGCKVEKCSDAEKWVAMCNDARTGEAVYVGPDGQPIPYESPDFQKRLFDSLEAAQAAVLVGYRVFGLGSMQPEQRQREALVRIQSCNIDVRIHDYPLLNAIEPAQLRAYIERHGWWKIGPSKRDGIEIWSAGLDDSGNEMGTPIPVDRRFGDYAYSIGHIVTSLSQLLKRSELLVIKEILEIGDEVATPFAGQSSRVL